MEWSCGEKGFGKACLFLLGVCASLAAALSFAVPEWGHTWSQQPENVSQNRGVGAELSQPGAPSFISS